MAKHGVVQVHFPESGKIKDDQKSGYDLADHGCPGCTFDAPAESKDEKRVQDGVDGGTGQDAGHGIGRTPVCSDQVVAACA